MPRVSARKPEIDAAKQVIARTQSSINVDVRERAFAFAMLGATNTELAALLGINRATVDNWMEKDEGFQLAVQEGRAQADANVVASLYRNATGFEYPTIKTFYDKDSGQVIEHHVMEYHKPDTTAQIFWLKNRQRDRWRDVNAGTAEGGIFVNINLG